MQGEEVLHPGEVEMQVPGLLQSRGHKVQQLFHVHVWQGAGHHFNLMSKRDAHNYKMQNWFSVINLPGLLCLTNNKQI